MRSVRDEYIAWLHERTQKGEDHVTLDEYCKMKGVERPPDVPVSFVSKGLGDTISKITHALGIPECGGCKKRRDWLNEYIPYKGDQDGNSTVE